MRPEAIYRSPEGGARVMAWYAAALSRFEVPCESLTVQTRYGATHVLAAGPGDAPALVLIHGLGGCAPLWGPQIAAFSAIFRVYALDTVGQPGRSAPTRPSHRNAAYAQWLVDILDTLRILRASVVGLSMGGRLAMQFAIHAPERVARVALMSPIGIKTTGPWFVARGLPIGLDLRRPADDKVRALIRLMLGYDQLPPNVERDRTVLEGMVLVVRYYRFATTLTQALDGVSLFFPLPTDQLRRLIAPTLLLMGAHERLFDPEAVIARARSVLPALVAAEIVPQAGHAMNYDRPDDVNARVLEFLRQG